MHFLDEFQHLSGQKYTKPCPRWVLSVFVDCHSTVLEWSKPCHVLGTELIGDELRDIEHELATDITRNSA